MCFVEKTKLCVDSKTLTVCASKTPVCHVTHRRFDSTHGDVLDAHTVSVLGRLSLSVCLSLSLTSHMTPSLLPFPCQVSLALSLFSRRINDNDKDHSLTKLSVQKALTCPEGQSAWTSAQSCSANCWHRAGRIVFRYTCATLVPLGMKRAGTCAEDGEVFTCVKMCRGEHCLPCGRDGAGVVWWGVVLLSW